MLVEQVRDGVFFTHPDDLPRGRHVLGRDEVVLRQRERLMIAVTEQMAAAGYRTVGVREISSHARISRAAFYECFDDKDACVFAAYARFIEVLVEKVATAMVGHQTWDETVEAVVSAYLGTLASDLVVARAFQVEMDALGRPARAERQKALNLMAHVLKAKRDELWPGAERLPLSAYLGAVYALRQLSSDLIDASPTPDLAALRDEAKPWLAQLLASAFHVPGTTPG